MYENSPVPVWEKVCLSIGEAAQYSGIGEKTIRQALKQPGCTFAFYVGSKTLVKRKEFENYISRHREF